MRDFSTTTIIFGRKQIQKYRLVRICTHIRLVIFSNTLRWRVIAQCKPKVRSLNWDVLPSYLLVERDAEDSDSLIDLSASNIPNVATPSEYRSRSSSRAYHKQII